MTDRMPTYVPAKTWLEGVMAEVDADALRRSGWRWAGPGEPEVYFEAWLDEAVKVKVFSTALTELGWEWVGNNAPAEPAEPAQQNATGQQQVAIEDGHE